MASDPKNVSKELDEMSDKLRQIRESQVSSGSVHYSSDGDLATVKFNYKEEEPELEISS